MYVYFVQNATDRAFCIFELGVLPKETSLAVFQDEVVDAGSQYAERWINRKCSLQFPLRKHLHVQFLVLKVKWWSVTSLTLQWQHGGTPLQENAVYWNLMETCMIPTFSEIIRKSLERKKYYFVHHVGRMSEASSCVRGGNMWVECMKNTELRQAFKSVRFPTALKSEVFETLQVCSSLSSSSSLYLRVNF